MIDTITTRVAPRYGTPNESCVFVGWCEHRDLYYYPHAQCALVKTPERELLVTAYEETLHEAQLYDAALELYTHLLSRRERVA